MYVTDVCTHHSGTHAMSARQCIRRCTWRKHGAIFCDIHAASHLTRTEVEQITASEQC